MSSWLEESLEVLYDHLTIGSEAIRQFRRLDGLFVR